MKLRNGFYMGLLGLLVTCSPDARAGQVEEAPAVADTNVFRVADFGAVGDGTTDDGPAVRKAVEAAVAAGAGSSVLFDKKTYRLGRFDGQAQITLDGVSGITIDGYGAEIINNPYNGFISISDCSNVTMRGFFLDCDPLGFTQGDIVKVDSAKGEIWVKIHKGFIHPLEISKQLKKQVWSRVGFTIDAHERKLKPGPIDFIESIKANGDLVRVKLKDPGFTHIVRGDRFIFGLHQGGHGATIDVQRSADVLLEDYTIYSAKFGMHHTFSDNPGRVRPEVDPVFFVWEPDVDRLHGPPPVGQVADGKGGVDRVAGGEDGHGFGHRLARSSLGPGDVEGNVGPVGRIPDPPASVLERQGPASEALNAAAGRRALVFQDDSSLLPGAGRARTRHGRIGHGRYGRQAAEPGCGSSDCLHKGAAIESCHDGSLLERL